MSHDSNKEEDDSIHRVDTIPPPDGEGDAYNAPTKVGPMADSVMKEMLHAAELKAAELAQRSSDKMDAVKAKQKEEGAAAAAAASEKPPATSEKPPVSAPPVSSSKGLVAAASARDGALARPARSPSSSPIKPSPATAPKPPAVPASPAVPATKAAAASPAASASPSASPSGAPASPAASAEDEAPPRLLYTEDEEENAATMLHRNAKAPVVAPSPQHTAPLAPSVVAAAVEASNARAESLRSSSSVVPSPLSPQAAPGAAAQRLALLPLAVGALLFVAGLIAYLYVR